MRHTWPDVHLLRDLGENGSGRGNRHAMSEILVGACSWTDRALVSSGWYPAGRRDAEGRLRHYAERFPVVEVDATYYWALPSSSSRRGSVPAHGPTRSSPSAPSAPPGGRSVSSSGTRTGGGTGGSTRRPICCGRTASPPSPSTWSSPCRPPCRPSRPSPARGWRSSACTAAARPDRPPGPGGRPGSAGSVARAAHRGARGHGGRARRGVWSGAVSRRWCAGCSWPVRTPGASLRVPRCPCRPDAGRRGPRSW